ncbi:MAG: DNA translocase FtsK 4TM domain-containing protein, partial [Bacteroidales bacterium]|nr:DNA translocase FtsK 4TM domain-containing protein [Bacteroidales bacterium]
MNPLRKYWESLSERKQTGIRYGGICLVLILTLTVAISVVSYMFTWRQDQSALNAAGDVIQNAAASSGLSIGHFLVTDSFGLGAFCVLAFLIAWCVKLLWTQSPIRLRKWFYGCFTMAFVLSWISSLVGVFTGVEYAFIGGLGGRAGAAVVGFLISKLGEIITSVLLLALLGGWFYCMSEHFAHLLMGKKKVLPEGPNPADEAPFETADTFVPETDDDKPEDNIPAFTVTDTVDGAPLKKERPRRIRKPKEEGEEEQEGEEEGGINVITDDTLEQEVKEPLKPIDN